MLPLAAAAAAVLAAGVAAGANESMMRGVPDPKQARIDYMLKCQGCHRPDGGGDDRSNPPMKHVVAQFLGVPGGREFLGRVPGVSTVDLDNVRLANLVNWTLYTFDAAHMPSDFRPYTPEEIGQLRRHPLRLERADMRARLVAGFAQERTETQTP
ncbi:MAG: cytochrome C [Novosphingobium sp. 16-62-11]|uniref:cytochrome C n=1 Tax=Novosphingobium sp. 17-62-19 TaxID=1970406 RepID=UPI000BCD9580|nr:cytochrome C [Novosphingobium sp. 17-62-19]OYZ43204.1 MAG: cytochrome C [Novosphingobium sp. 16-62-11]OZA21255.1 MAG: cytochrome C [Novosphingobium sp. 17-62-19]HQS98564.1 cytochrome C [Novosphingobium sp.]